MKNTTTQIRKDVLQVVRTALDTCSSHHKGTEAVNLSGLFPETLYNQVMTNW